MNDAKRRRVTRPPPEKQAIGDTPRRAAVSWTGGKDCNLALLDTWRRPDLEVVALVVFRPANAAFRAHPLPLMELQARSLGLPLRHVIVAGPDYKASYVAGMAALRDDLGLQVLVTGDMALVGSMKRNWIEECGEDAGLEAALPLWGADRAALLERLQKEKLEVVFSCVKSPWFSADWIGRRVDAEAVADMKAIGQDLDLGGENGEYHTMCLDGPLFSEPLHLDGVTPGVVEAAEGQPESQQWWVLEGTPALLEQSCSE